MIRLDSLIFLAIPWIIYRVVVLAVKKQLSLKIELIKALFYFSVIFIYSLTLFPFPFYVYPHMERGDAFQLMNLTPFATIYSSLTHFNYMVTLRNIFGNILNKSKLENDFHEKALNPLKRLRLFVLNYSAPLA
ncbi:hypothetical protein SAMN05444673_3218 [Bacillus sp. OV166]|uniref:hypothetical protein n=1 Tax=Bacillus sp. OV166 TaxID=1882763 RepID=UPI000A2AB4F7|nr:hypothetical protein [Bacillus sp. OV166]SMQ78058.1 hypothetical protein SAMN05444673_3218 [Bacillus sp. OV166]